MVEPRPPRDDTAKPAQRIRKLRMGVRAVWWSAVVLTLVFVGLALWIGVGRRDPVALFFAVLAVCSALAGYGTLLAVRRPPASAPHDT